MKKYIKYLNYLIRHKWFVFLECVKVGKIWRGITHDLSKFRPDEFVPYARHFYGNCPDWEHAKKLPGYPYKLTKQGVEEIFDLAWLKHQHRNPHHWQYWVLREDGGDTKILNMPQKYLLEMVADWKGAGRAIKRSNTLDECIGWYLDNYDKIKVSYITRTEINKLLKVVKW